VFGIEGKWGSGKSTLINLTIEALKTHSDDAPEIISFSPWLVGERDELLHTLFDELATAVISIDPVDAAVDPTHDDRLKLKKEELRKALGEKLQTFGTVAGTIGKLARVAGAAGIPLADLVAVAAERSSDAAKQFVGGSSISKRKAELITALRQLSRRIVVFIDDLDRLEPHEASEVLRLVRAVADFPNVIYVLSYDPDVLAQTLVKAVQVDDGAAFLEKMVQVSFRVPRPEAFDLRRWFQAELQKMFAREFDVGNECRMLLDHRLDYIIQVQGRQYLETGRDVVRALNALRLHGIPVRDLIDIPDMVWLQLIRIGNSTFYTWIEEYLTEVAAIANGGTLSDEAVQAMDSRLEGILAGNQNSLPSLIELGQVLPGFNIAGASRKPRIFYNVRGERLHRLVVSRRLGSPQHYRYYFAFSTPAGSLPDEQVQAFIELAQQTPPEAIEMFFGLSREARPQGGTKAEVLIDRLIAWSDRVREEAIPGILASFAATMDKIATSHPAGRFGDHAAWRIAERAVTVLLKRVTGEVRAESLRTLFEEGQALGWLSDILRGEIFSHGHFGDRPQPEQEWLLTAEEFTRALTTMLRRYRETPAAELMRAPRLLNLLFAWLQGSGTDEARKWVEAQTATDLGLLTFLSAARGRVSSSSIGVYYPLRRSDLEVVLDVDRAIQRVEAISTRPDASATDRRLTSDLLIAFDQGKQ
jgi:hypothetical protein